jgi:hypothetical protein
MRNLRNLVVGFSLGIVGVALADPAAALVMCGRKTGSGQLAPGSTIKLRDACKVNEALVDPVALGLQGPKGDQGDQGVAGPPGPGSKLKDANGTVVGPVFFFDLPSTRTVVAVSVGSVRFAVEARQDGTALYGGSPPQFYYASDDCTGPSLVYSSSVPSPAGLLDSTVSASPAPQYQVYYPTGPGVHQTAHSYRAVNGGSCQIGTNDLDLAPVAGSVTFTTPFHIEIQ